MPRFPKNESEVTTLAESMIAGYTDHAADFPSMTTSAVNDLSAVLDTYRTERQAQTNARAQAKMATETKTTKLDTLVEKMRNDLKLSEVDVADDPAKLGLIGWGPRQNPQPIEAPSQPNNLYPVFEGQGILGLAWDSSVSGGMVRNYVVERREQPAGGGEFGNWAIVGSSINNELNLTNQPRSVQMEYRVKAVNTGGDSTPSNTAAVVL